MHPAAVSMAKAIAKSKQHSVLVLDFYGPGNKFTELGRTLAEKFSAALAQSSEKFTVADRQSAAEILEKKGVWSSSLGNVDVATWAAGELKIPVVVVGMLTETGDNLAIQLNSYRVDSQKSISGFNITYSISNETRNLTSELVDYPQPQINPSMPFSGKNGYTFPGCDYCPQARYTHSAIEKNTQGTVLLIVVVGTDGKAHDVVVIKPLPNGLTETAIEAVQSWQFKPAKGPDGNPAAVRQFVEVSFHLYKWKTAAFDQSHTPNSMPTRSS